MGRVRLVYGSDAARKPGPLAAGRLGGCGGGGWAYTGGRFAAMDWSTILSGATLVGVIGIGAWVGSVNTKLEYLTKQTGKTADQLTQLSRDVSELRVALAGLRAELFEKFQPKTHA